MGITVFSFEGGSEERSLEVSGDGTITYYRANSGWAAAKHGIEFKTERLTLEEAQKRWPSYASEIAQAVRRARRKKR